MGSCKEIECPTQLQIVEETADRPVVFKNEFNTSCLCVLLTKNGVGCGGLSPQTGWPQGPARATRFYPRWLCRNNITLFAAQSLAYCLKLIGNASHTPEFCAKSAIDIFDEHLRRCRSVPKGQNRTPMPALSETWKKPDVSIRPRCLLSVRVLHRLGDRRQHQPENHTNCRAGRPSIFVFRHVCTQIGSPLLNTARQKP